MRLSSNFFQGDLASLETVGSLTTLDLGDNRLAGDLEPLAHLLLLKVLVLRNNCFSGTLDSLASLTELQTLDVFDNHLQGGLIGLRGLTRLERLTLDRNSFEGDVTPLETLENLRELTMEYNHMQGPTIVPCPRLDGRKRRVHDAHQTNTCGRRHPWSNPVDDKS